MTKFWVGGTGTWDAFDTTHWSDQSGGMGGAAVTTQSDDVRINNLSGGGTVTLGATGNYRSLDCTGFGGTFDMATQALNVGYTDGGAFVLAVNPMQFHSSLGAVINFVATSDNGGNGWDIKTFGKGLPELKFDSAGGKWTVQGSMNTVSGTRPRDALEGRAQHERQELHMGVGSLRMARIAGLSVLAYRHRR